MLKFFLIFSSWFLCSLAKKTPEEIKGQPYVKSVVLLSYNMEYLLNEVTHLFSPYEARTLESILRVHLGDSWHDPRAKVEIYYIQTQNAKLIQHISFVGNGKKIQITFNDFEKDVVIEEAPVLLKLECLSGYSFDDYNVPQQLQDNVYYFLQRMKKVNTYQRYSKIIVLYRADFEVKAIILVDKRNRFHYFIDCDALIVNRKGESVFPDVFPKFFGLRIKTHITSRFGARYHPVSGARRFHSGIDLRAPKGTPVYAVFDGKIVFKGWQKGYGNCIKINHGNNTVSLYGHLSQFALGIKNGKFVKRGDMIAFSGSTGMSTAPHLHFEIRVQNKPVDPTKFPFYYYKVIPLSSMPKFKLLLKEIHDALL